MQKQSALFVQTRLNNINNDEIMNQTQIMKTTSFIIKKKIKRNQENEKTINMYNIITTIIEIKLIDKSKQVRTKKTRKCCETNNMIIHD